MLRLSNRGRYAVRAVFDLAFHAGWPVSAGPPAQVRDVADRQRIPLRFLEQIFQELKRAGIVESKRGPRGGFTLAKPADEIRLGDVLRAVEGPVALAPKKPERKGRGAADGGVRSAERVAELRDVADDILVDVGRSVERCFDGVTLRDLCERGEEAGVVRRGTAVPARAGAARTRPPRWVI